jgi:hypothetical protein
LQARRLRPPYEEVLQDIFAIGRGERLFANLAMQLQIARARRRLGAHDLIARLAPRADEIGNIGFDHGPTYVRAWVGFLLNESWIVKFFGGRDLFAHSSTAPKNRQSASRAASLHI